MAEEPLTLQEIGDVYGISRERVRQIQVRITKKIKSYLQEEIEGIEDLYSELLWKDPPKKTPSDVCNKHR